MEVVISAQYWLLPTTPGILSLMQPNSLTSPIAMWHFLYENIGSSLGRISWAEHHVRILKGNSLWELGKQTSTLDLFDIKGKSDVAMLPSMLCWWLSFHLCSLGASPSGVSCVMGGNNLPAVDSPFPKQLHFKHLNNHYGKHGIVRL
jgi:hypothetical protein